MQAACWVHLRYAIRQNMHLKSERAILPPQWSEIHWTGWLEIAHGDSMQLLRPVLLTLAVLWTASTALADERPNILFIYADDQSHRTVGCYPESFDWVRTPNLDGLAEQGVRFAHAYIGTWCMPSRATLLTGHHPYAVESMRMEGQYPGSEYDPEKCPFWPKYFRTQGYTTAQIGKWHTGTDTGMGRDWDYQIVWNRPKHPKNSGSYYKDQLTTFNDGTTKMVEGYTTDNYTQWALEFLRGEQGRASDDGKPWYLWLCYGAVHGPFTPADRHKGAYKDAEVPIPADIFGPREGKPDWAQKINHFTKAEDGTIMNGRQTFADAVRQYHEGVLAIDEGVEKLIATLKETGQYDNTLIIYTADQGFAWGQHGFRRKVAGYDATIRAPLIISMPSRIPTGKVCEQPVGGVDLVPTIFDYAGVDLPWEVHGHSLRPLLEQPESTWDHPVLITYTGREYGSDTDELPTGKDLMQNGIPWYSMVRQGRFKYIRSFVEGDLDEFYDLEKDPEELVNLAQNPEYAEKIAQYRQELVAELERTGAKFAHKLPPVRE